MWASHLVIYGSPVSPPSGRAWGKVTAWVFVRRRDHRPGRAPWPGPHRGPAGRAGGPPASGARAGPSAGGCGSAALCLISSAGPPHLVGAGGGQPGPGGLALGETVRIPACAGRHPKVPARWNIAARRPVTRRCYQVGWGAVSGNAAMATAAPPDQLVFCVDHEPECGADFRLGDENPRIDEFRAQRQRDGSFLDSAGRSVADRRPARLCRTGTPRLFPVAAGSPLAVAGVRAASPG